MTVEILTQDDLAMFVMSDSACYKQGMTYANLYRHDSLAFHVRWVEFVEYAISRYSREVLRKYDGCTLPLDQWGTMAEYFRKDYIAKVEELKTYEEGTK